MTHWTTLVQRCRSTNSLLADDMDRAFRQLENERDGEREAKNKLEAAYRATQALTERFAASLDRAMLRILGERDMGVPTEAPKAVHDFYASLPNCAEINLLFKPLYFGPIVRVKCEGWGQLANDAAATNQAMYHIKNKRPMWFGKYIGWEEIGGARRGDAPADFEERSRRHWKSRGY